ncbi:hypothetical protein BJF84_17190 [Rhodococcus sp. CUA-806]|nr:hypothetical protein BJF84_17190 [Rhodococcus sp. CUA-806]
MGAFVLALLAGVMVVLETTLTVVIIGTILLTLVFILCVRNFDFAWVAYFLSICANGVAVDVGSLTVRPEYLATPLFFVSAIVNLDRKKNINGLVSVGLLGWISIAAIASLWFSPDSAASARMLFQLIVAVAPIVILAVVQVDPIRLVRSGTWILALVSVVSIAVWLPSRDYRIAALAFEPNIMGSLCAGWLCVMTYYAIEKK